MGLVASLFSAAPVLAAGNSQGQSSVDPAGPAAQHIADLFWIVMVPALLVLVVVGSAILYTAFHFRERDGETRVPRQVGGNNALELTWTLVPALILAGILILSFTQMPFLRHSPQPDAMHIKVIGRQWAWSFEYPGKTAKGAPITQFGTMVIPVGEVVNLDIESKDVIHSWSVPRLGGRMDAIPGQHNTTWVEADRVGVYYGQCTEFCGLSHSAMTVKVQVLSKADFDAWFNKLQGGA